MLAPSPDSANAYSATEIGEMLQWSFSNNEYLHCPAKSEAGTVAQLTESRLASMPLRVVSVLIQEPSILVKTQVAPRNAMAPNTAVSTVCRSSRSGPLSAWPLTRALEAFDAFLLDAPDTIL